MQVSTRDYYLSTQQVGKGAYSPVQYAYYVQDSTRIGVACKVIKEDSNQLFNRLLEREKLLQKFQNHDNIINVQSLKIYDESQECYTFMELCDSDLRFLMNQKKKSSIDSLQNSQQLLPSKFSTLEVNYIMNQSINGYSSLIEQKIIHRDLKPENLLIKNNKVKIADFGEVKQLINQEEYDQQLYQTAKCTTCYGSPQIINSDEPYSMYSSKTDIWSLGIILYELVYGKHPYPQNVTNRFHLREFFRHNSCFEQPQPLNDENLNQYWKVIKRMIEFEENDRISWDELVRYKEQLFWTSEEVQLIPDPNIIQDHQGIIDRITLSQIITCELIDNEPIEDEFYKKPNDVQKIKVMRVSNFSKSAICQQK